MRYQPLGPFHVQPIVGAKTIEHHFLFIAHSAKVQHCKRHQRRRAYDPIGQQKCLSRGIQEEGRVHRMSNRSVDAMFDELMILPQFKARRPIGAKIPMGSIKNPESRYNDDRSNGERRGIKLEIRKRKNIKRDPQEGQQNAAYCGEHYQSNIKAAFPVLVGFDGFVSFDVRMAKIAEHQKADYKDGFAEPNVHVTAS
jgi:hypothetical protein